MRASSSTGGGRLPATGAESRGLERPTVVAWLREITAVIGAEQSLQAWSRATQSTSLHGMALSPEQLDVLGKWLLDNSSDPVLRTTVRSCLVRLNIWRTLENTRGGPQ